MTKIGLVLEGDGMRGAYTAGVLDAFLDFGIHFLKTSSVYLRVRQMPFPMHLGKTAGRKRSIGGLHRTINI